MQPISNSQSSQAVVHETQERQNTATVPSESYNQPDAAPGVQTEFSDRARQLSAELTQARLEAGLLDYYPAQVDYAFSLSHVNDRAGALQSLKLVADQGNVLAQYNYAGMLRDGEGGPVDLGQALHYARLAQAQGHMLAGELIYDILQLTGNQAPTNLTADSCPIDNQI